MGGLVAGINGATVLSVFSPTLPGTFLVPRSVPATAALFTEPTLLPISRQSIQNQPHHDCPRPVIRLGETLEGVQNKVSPLTEIYSRLTAPITKITSRISSVKSDIMDQLRLSCLFPRMLRPFEPILEYTRCKLGLKDDGFMETPPCNATLCREPSLQDRPITRDLGVPNFDFMMEGKVSTLDECFPNMDKIDYGARVIAKLVDDQSCDDPKYSSICQDLMQQNRTVLEESCETSK